MTEDKIQNESESTKNNIDIISTKNKDQILDSESMILETQKRVWGALKKGYEYSGMVDDSDQFLRKNVQNKGAGCLAVCVS